jgi:hypothetical protein
VLFDQRFWPGIGDGSITLAFRRWKRPTVRPNGRLELAIESVDVVEETGISESDARRAGFESRDALLGVLKTGTGTLYRIAFRLKGPDIRIAIRQQVNLGADELRAITGRLARMDRYEVWTLRTLRLIAERPATRAADLAATIRSETLPFKVRVRKLKELGLTESLESGYRLSPRGRAVLEHLAIEATSGR